MHIIQVTPRYFPTLGGVEAVVQKISESLVERGIQVTVYSVDRHSCMAAIENINGVIVKRFIPLFGDPLYLPEPKFAANLRKEHADIVHSHNIHTTPLLFSALTKQSDQKLLLQPHYHRYGQSPIRHSLFELYKKAFYGTIFSKTDGIIANSGYEKQILVEDFPNAKNLFLLPEGLEINEVLTVKHEPVEPKRVLYVGVLKGYKNVSKIIEGFSGLIRNGNIKFRLVIVGGGPERHSLVDLASKLKISEYVEWKSNLSREQLLSEYARASVFVMLSPLESFSRVVYDALFIGVPVVVLNFGALGHLVSEGFVEGVDSLAKESVANAILKATEKSYRKMSLNDNNFLDWGTYLQRLISIYQNLLEI
jgi:glycosyltransferase involved in cell wall biosynthesis